MTTATATLAKIANRELFIPEGDKVRKKSTRIANAMALELINYGIRPSDELVMRIAMQKKDVAQQYADTILKMYTIGNVNPPLFQDWEERTSFTFIEFIVQICGYMLQVSGNDLDDPQYMSRLKADVDFKKFKTLKLANADKAHGRFTKLVRSTVALDRKTRDDLVALAELYHMDAPKSIKSDEARIAVLVGMANSGADLLAGMAQLNCKAADALRFAAAMHDFDGVKLPADVKYGRLSWPQRLQLMGFLARSSFDELCEDMGNNRTAWKRFFGHTHVAGQRVFRNRFTHVVAAAQVSVGSKMSALRPVVAEYLQGNQKFYDITESGNMAYRTFASRVQTAVDAKDLDALEAEIRTRPGYLFRNIATLSHVCTKKTESQFVELVRGFIDKASTAVLFSLIQIDTNAEYRIIDSKGNTTVTDADYSPVIAEIQGLAERELHRRHGFDKQMTASKSLEKSIVPFLSTNAELDRGTKIPFEDAPYLYFLMHWVQDKQRTDLDHSYICFDANWKAETIYFGNQANSFIKQSGDITNAPAPNGGTEYGRIDLDKIPANVQYIVPICNVYCGEVFNANQVAYAGFMFSDSATFSLKRKHVRYDLNQPANANVPFVIDVKSKEIIIVDFNNRMKNGITAHSDAGDIRKIILALKSKRFMTIGRLANLLSGDEDGTALHVCKNPKTENEIAPADLFSLFE